ncbi:MAG: helix-turn-helix domain-containing protein, partial [Patescibacteria group bacterium]
MTKSARVTRRISPFLKKRAVFAVLKRGKSVSSVSRDLGIARKTLYSWIKRYKDTPLRNKRHAFETKYVSGKNHPRSLKEKARHSLIRLIVAHPDWGCRKYSMILKDKGIELGYFGVNKALKKLGAETPDLRKNFARNYSGPGRLQADVKFEIVRKVIEDGEKVQSLSKEYLIARKTIYKWINQFQKAQKEGLEGTVALRESYVAGKSHPRAVYPQIQDKVLGIVRENPNLSVHKISKLVPVSNYTVWKILNSNNLNLFKQRLVFSQAQKQAQVTKPVPTGFFDRIRLVWEQFMPSLA